MHAAEQERPDVAEARANWQLDQASLARASPRRLVRQGLRLSIFGRDLRLTATDLGLRLRDALIKNVGLADELAMPLCEGLRLAGDHLRHIAVALRRGHEIGGKRNLRYEGLLGREPCDQRLGRMITDSGLPGTALNS